MDAQSAQESTDSPDDILIRTPVLALDHFNFVARVFQVDGVWFQYDETSGAAAFWVPMGAMTACIPVSRVMREFSIDPDGSDGHLLLRIEQALKYAPVIRPGDSIPSELIDGTASWKYEISHKLVAEGRLLWHLLRWAEIDVLENPSPEELISFGQDEDQQKDRALAMLKITAQQEEYSEKELSEFMGQLSVDLAYIEALREHFSSIFQLQSNFARARQVCRGQKEAAEEFGRISTLTQKPLRLVREKFAQIDLILSSFDCALYEAEVVAEKIRKIRNQLHLESCKWQPIVADWNSVKKPTDDLQLRRRIYHFLASQWPLENNWPQSGS